MLDMNQKELTVVHGLGVNLYFNLLMLKIISSCIIHDIIIMICFQRFKNN